MDIKSPPGTIVTFDAYDGYESDHKLELEVLKIGEKYTVEYINVYKKYSIVKLKGYEGFFNTVMFAASAVSNTTNGEKNTSSSFKNEPKPKTIEQVVTAALFDFMGMLTSQEEKAVLSSSDDTMVALKMIKRFAEKRGLSLKDPIVMDWCSVLIGHTLVKDKVPYPIGLDIRGSSDFCSAGYCDTCVEKRSAKKAASEIKIKG